MIANYVKKPIWIKAVKWTGQNKEELNELAKLNLDTIISNQ